MKNTDYAAAGTMALLIVAGGCQASPGPSAPSRSGQASISSPSSGHAGVLASSVEVCHRTEGDSPFVLITVDDSAVPAHLGHGDGVPGQSVPGQPGSVFGLDCQVETAAQCPCWAGLTEAQLVAMLAAALGPQQADCTMSGSDVFVRGINGNVTELSAIETSMSCTLRAGAIDVSVSSVPATAFAACLAQAKQVIPQLSACYD